MANGVKRNNARDKIRGSEYQINSLLEKELVSISYTTSVKDKAALGESDLNAVSEDEKNLITKVKNIPSSTWFTLSRWAKETNNFQPWQRSLLFSIGTIINRDQNPTYKQAVQANNIFTEAVKKGFIQ